MGCRVAITYPVDLVSWQVLHLSTAGIGILGFGLMIPLIYLFGRCVTVVLPKQSVESTGTGMADCVAAAH